MIEHKVFSNCLAGGENDYLSSESESSGRHPLIATIKIEDNELIILLLYNTLSVLSFDHGRLGMVLLFYYCIIF